MVQHVVKAFDSAQANVQRRMLIQLIGQVYELASPEVRRRLLAHLLRPLGVLSLVAVANGMFAKFRFGGDLQSLQVHVDDANAVGVKELTVLVDFVEQVSVDTINGLAGLLVATPGIAGTAAAVVLVSVLIKRAQSRRSGDSGLLTAEDSY
jgi:hypothetical protein